jgi:hypothetical protein
MIPCTRPDLPESWAIPCCSDKDMGRKAVVGGAWWEGQCGGKGDTGGGGEQ